MSRPILPESPPSQRNALGPSMAADKVLLPEVSSMLQLIVDTLHNPLFCSFLFSDEPLHLQPFTSPEFAHASLTCELQVTRVGAPPALPCLPTTSYPTNEISQKSFGNYLFTHRLTLDQISMGVGVLEYKETIETSQRWELLSSLTVTQDMRFIHNARERYALLVLDTPEHDQLMIKTSLCDTSTSGYILLAAFRRRDIMDIIRKRPETLDVRTLFRALTGFVQTSRVRSCPTCNASPATGCGCYRAAVQAPAHLFDARLFKSAMAQDFGDYHGLTSKVMFDESRRAKRLNVGAHLSFRGGFDQRVGDRLRTWALTSFARRWKEHPGQSSRLLGGAKGFELGRRSWEYQGDTAEQGNSKDPITILEPLLDQLNSISIDDDEDQTGQATGEKESDAMFGWESVEKWLDGDDKQEAKTLPNDRQSVGLGLEVLRSPLMDREAVGLLNEASVGKSEEGSILKDLHAARRRVRNRASAHRSNERKRALRETIRDELKAMQERSEVLRMEETKLRAENMELRRQVGALYSKKQTR